jgi:hypothetical protein
MSEIKLSLQSPENNNQQGDQKNNTPPQPDPAPVAGYLAVGLALLGIFTTGYIFVPLSFLASIIALFSGQILWGIFGVLLSFAGLLTSPVLLTFLGVAWLASVFGV